MSKSRKYCEGCRQDFYNGHNGLGIKECMHFKSARVCNKEVYLTKNSKHPIKIKTLECFSPSYS